MAAGLGFKTFTTGEVLTAADTNGYLMQGVLVFASAAARDAAITSPQEGQCCYLKDTDSVLTYSGAAWVGFDDSNAIQNTIVAAKGDIIGASANDVPAVTSVGANETRLVADSVQTTGLKYVADTTNYAIDAKGDLLAGTAADTLSALTVGTNFAVLLADSSTGTGLVWDNSSWTTYTPSITAASGSFTTVSATGAFKRIGKVVFAAIKITITTNGTAAAAVVASLPVTAVSATNFYGVFRETALTGAMGQIEASTNSAVFRKSDNNYPGANGAILQGSITYEVA